MRVEISVTRAYEMDVDKIRRDFAAELAADVASGLTEDQALRETFYELCGWERDRDHRDGSYIWLTDESVEIEEPFDFAEAANSHSESGGG